MFFISRAPRAINVLCFFRMHQPESTCYVFFSRLLAGSASEFLNVLCFFTRLLCKNRGPIFFFALTRENPWNSLKTPLKIFFRADARPKPYKTAPQKIFSRWRATQFLVFSQEFSPRHPVTCYVFFAPPARIHVLCFFFAVLARIDVLCFFFARFREFGRN